ncbi:hypothetical protein FACS189479_09960 [Spirochaetia bacterium]|nr:hypothetical protein FACS189479_09960 [Spirochaetia bacterium]
METSVIKTRPVNIDNKSGAFKPQTEFGKKLQMLRNRAIAEGMQLKSCDEILAEIEAERQS